VVAVSGRRPVGAVDNIWLNMDRPTNLMVIDSIMWFDGTVDWARFEAVLLRRIVDHFPVFRQRLADPGLGLNGQHWEDDPDFDLADHLVRVTLPVPGGEGELAALVEQRMSVPFDRAHALWEFLLVDGYEGRSAVVGRFHHALADGMALAEVLLRLTDATPDGDQDEAEHPFATQKTEARNGFSLPGGLSLPSLPIPGLAAGTDLVSGLLRRARPSFVADAFTLAQQTTHIADKLILGSVPDSPLTGTPGIDKRAVWSSPRSVDEVKRIARLSGATVNDVLVGAVTGAITEYVLHHGAEPRDVTTMVPINLRPPGKPLPRELGNKFALVMLPLPSATRAPLERLAETKRRMDSIKRSPEAVITFGLINAIGLTHPRIEEPLVTFFSGKAIGVTTNVMGPTTDRFVAGVRLAGILGWVPGSGKQTLGVCIFSYNRMVRVGFKTDATIVPDPERLVATFDEELDELARMAKAF
jgi:WS/DGAT/MGAT family acyltransferase